MVRNQYNIHEYYDIRHSSELPPEKVGEIAICIHSAFGGTITHQDAHKHMEGDKVVVAHHVTENGIVLPEVAGFSSTVVVSPAVKFKDDSMLDRPGSYLEGVAIAENHQGHGLFRQLTDNYLRHSLTTDTDFMFTRTQNPKVMSGLNSGMERAVAEGTIRRYRLEVKLAQHAYKGMLTATKPNTENTIFDEIEHGNGDAYVLTWFYDR